MSEMPANGNQHLATFGLMVTVGLLLMLAVQVGVTAAANGTSAASSRAVQGDVTIHLWGPGLGPGDPGRGRFDGVGGDRR